MPRLPIDYSKTIIYKLCCLDQSITDIYIGHTTDFTKRKNAHKSDCNRKKGKGYNYKVYQFIRNNGGFENWSMIQIEEYKCNNKREADARETFWMKELKSTLNSCQSFITKEERKQQNNLYHKTDKCKEYHTEYHKTDKYKEYHTEYHKTDKWINYAKKYRQTKALYLKELNYYNI